MKDALKKLSAIVASDEPGRTVPAFLDISYWEKALSLLSDASRVVLITGFMVPEAGAPETDGPPGSAVLGRALASLGKDVLIVTDPNCLKGVKGCSSSIEGPPVVLAEHGKDIFSFEPDLLVFVERLGKASDGRYYNMRCEDISSVTYPLDEAALDASEMSIPVIAIGDGGNEAGMGLIAQRLSNSLGDFRNCVSVIPSDVILPVDVSNWGAYALASLLSLSHGKWLGHSGKEEETMLREMIALGCVDGATRARELSVDGFPLFRNLEIVTDLEEWWKRYSL